MRNIIKKILTIFLVFILVFSSFSSVFASVSEETPLDSVDAVTPAKVESEVIAPEVVVNPATVEEVPATVETTPPVVEEIPVETIVEPIIVPTEIKPEPIEIINVKDDYGNSIKTAEPISIDQSIDGYIGLEDIDFFMITVERNIILEIQTQGDLDTFGNIYYENGDSFNSDDDNGDGKNFMFSQDLEPGTYYISVKDFYPERVGKYTLVTKSTTINDDDYGNNMEKAAEIKLGESLAGCIEKPNDIDFFKFSVERQMLIDINGFGSTDTYGVLMYENGNQIAADDDNGEEKNFYISQELSPGTYFVSVKDFYSDRIGDYRISISGIEISGDDFGNTRDSAQEVKPNYSIKGGIQAKGDIDYFKLNIDQKGQIETFTSGTTDMLGSLEDEKGNLLATDDDNGEAKNFLITQNVNPGVYYIKVQHCYADRIGDYELSLAFTPYSDDFDNDRENAKELKPTDSIEGAIQTKGDIDYFMVNIDEKGQLEMFTTGTTDTLGSFENEKGIEIATGDDNGIDKNFNMIQIVEPGVYYIKVQHCYSDRIGAYTMNLVFNSYKDDYGNDFTTAEKIELNNGVGGSIQYYNDRDMFKFTLDNSLEMKIFSDGETDTFGTLYNENGDDIATNDDGGFYKNFEIREELNAGTYYLEVKHCYPNKLGEYKVVVEANELEADSITRLDEGDSNTCGFAYDGSRYAYVGCNITPARIVKFDTIEMKKVSYLDLPAGENRDECRVSAIISVSPNEVIHASYTNPCVFTKVNTDTMTITGTLVGEEGENSDKQVRAIVYDGQYVYAATYSDPAKIIKFDPITMTRVASYTFTQEEATNIHRITIVGDYIVGVSDRDSDSDSKIFRINKNDFSKPVDSVFVADSSNYHSICNDGRYIYAATDTNPIRVVKIDALSPTMTYKKTFTGTKDIEVGNYSVMYAAGSVFVGTWNFNAGDKIIKINPTNMAKISSKVFVPSFPADLHYINSYIYTCTDNATGNVVRISY